MKLPKLIAPAGNLEKLKTACRYGAEGVYFGLKNLNLRAASDNFTLDDIEQGLKFTEAMNVQSYLLFNSFMTDDDFSSLLDIISTVKKPTKFVLSDIGAISRIREKTDIPVVLSTQASCANSLAAAFYKDLGVNQIVLAREVSIPEAKEIKKKSGLAIEMFVHGAMCMGWSGNCMISTYTTGRDSNRGGCSHACRFHYETVNKSEIKARESLLCSKDLNGINLLPEFVKSGIDSLKIEGRMKSLLYLATIVKAYRKALDMIKNCEEYLTEDLFRETLLIPRRDYCEGFLKGYVADNVCDNADANALCGAEFTGIVKKVYPEGLLLLVKNTLMKGDDLEIITFKGENIKINSVRIYDPLNNELERSSPNKLVMIKSSLPDVEGAIVRKISR